MKPVLLDRAVMSDVKHVAMPTPGFPARPSVLVRNAIGDRFGLIGQVTGIVVRGNRANALAAMMASQSFDPASFFQAALTDRLQAAGLAVAPEAADGRRHAFLPAYPAGGGRDAVLDSFVTGYGFVALNDFDAAPYYPTVYLQTRLVHLPDQAVLMQDQVVISGVVGASAVPGGITLGLPQFRTFTEIETNPDRAVAALRAALSAAADGIAKRMT